MDVRGIIDGTLVSKKGNATLATIPVKGLQIKESGVAKICICRTTDGVNASLFDQVKVVSDLSNAVKTIPDRIEFSAIAIADGTRRSSFQLGRDYTITTNYDFRSPLAFAEDAQIVYRDSLDGWHSDIEDMEFADESNATLILTGNVENRIPAYLSVSAVAIDEIGRDISNDVEVTVKVDGQVDGNVGLTVLSAGFKAFGGYNTIELNSKTSFGVSLPYDLNASAQSYVELAFDHSLDITDKLRLGAKLKVLFGIARADVKFNNVTADLSSNDRWLLSGNAEANVSMKGFIFESEEKKYSSKPDTYNKVNDVDVDGVGLNGFGMALDFGGVYKINKDWTVSAALLDLSFIGWSNNITAKTGANQFEFNGFHDISVKDGIGSGTSIFPVNLFSANSDTAHEA